MSESNQPKTALTILPTVLKTAPITGQDSPPYLSVIKTTEEMSFLSRTILAFSLLNWRALSFEPLPGQDSILGTGINCVFSRQRQKPAPEQGRKSRQRQKPAREQGGKF